jgi:hypothetical protein
MNMISDFWHGVPVEFWEQWLAAFKGQKDIFVTVACPICGEAKLRQYYHLEKREARELKGYAFIGRGSYWSWCANCGKYEHSTSLVPTDWTGVTLPIDHSTLTPVPFRLEEAVLALTPK